MTPRDETWALVTGPFVIVPAALANALGTTAAGICNELHFHGKEEDEFWIRWKLNTWAREVGPAPSTIKRALDKLVANGLVERDDSQTTTGFRLVYRALVEIVEERGESLERRAADRLQPACDLHAERNGDALQNATEFASTPGNSADTGRGAATLDVDVDVDKTERPPLSRLTSNVPREAGDEEGEGGDQLHQQELNGLAPKWSVDHALYVLAKVGSPLRCKGLVHEMVQEALHELAHTDDTRKWAAEFAPDLPQWAVAKLLEHLRGAGDAERERMQARLVALAWKKHHGEAA